MKKTAILPAGLLFLFTSCATVGDDFVRAERTTYNAIASDYVEYVNADPSLTIDQKVSRKNIIQS